MALDGKSAADLAVQKRNADAQAKLSRLLADAGMPAQSIQAEVRVVQPARQAGWLNGVWVKAQTYGVVWAPNPAYAASVAAANAKISELRKLGRIVGDAGISWGKSFIPWPFSGPRDYADFLQSGRPLWRFSSPNLYGQQYYPVGDLRRFLVSADYETARAAWPGQMAAYADAPMRATQGGGLLTGLVRNPLFQAVAVVGGGALLAAQAGLVGAAASGGSSAVTGAAAAATTGAAPAWSAGLLEAAQAGALKSGAISLITTGKLDAAAIAKGALGGALVSQAAALGGLAGEAVGQATGSQIGQMIIGQGVGSALDQIGRTGKADAAKVAGAAITGAGVAAGVDAAAITAGQQLIDTVGGYSAIAATRRDAANQAAVIVDVAKQMISSGASAADAPQPVSAGNAAAAANGSFSTGKLLILLIFLGGIVYVGAKK